MSRQDKATTERHAKTLRELIKRAENKVCADCKRNDPRWASWNLGVFLCIRCSGIHRGMGTHISKVKSVDLDVWTPEQMESIAKWGNRRANLYWEARLKAGHVPPDHKMDSFIRSKYEACRWTLDGPPPSDPSILENGSRPSSPAPAPAPAAESNAGLQLDSPLQATRQAKQHRLLSVAIPAPASTPAVTRAPQPSSVPQPQPPKAPADDLLSLDFHAPPLDTTNLEPKKNPKQDILSLFSAPTSHTRAHFESRLSAASPQSSSWDQFSNQLQGQQQPPLTTSMMGGNGTAMWGASSGWNPAPVAAPAPGNLWANASSSNPWALSSATPTVSVAGADASSAQFVTKQKKDDAFTDLWK